MQGVAGCTSLLTDRLRQTTQTGPLFGWWGRRTEELCSPSLSSRRATCPRVPSVPSISEHISNKQVLVGVLPCSETERPVGVCHVLEAEPGPASRGVRLLGFLVPAAWAHLIPFTPFCGPRLLVSCVSKEASLQS